MLRPIRIPCVGLLISTGLICIHINCLPYERLNSIKYRNTSRTENHMQMNCNKIDHQIIIYVDEKTRFKIIRYLKRCCNNQSPTRRKNSWARARVCVCVVCVCVCVFIGCVCVFLLQIFFLWLWIFYLNLLQSFFYAKFDKCLQTLTSAERLWH